MAHGRRTGVAKMKRESADDFQNKNVCQMKLANKIPDARKLRISLNTSFLSSSWKNSFCASTQHNSFYEFINRQNVTSKSHT